MEKIIIAAIIFLSVIVGSCNQNHLDSQQNEKKDQSHIHWGYEGNSSPEHWAELSPEFIKCAEGHFQSPIDLESYVATKQQEAKLKFNYHPAPVDLVNNGHTVQANVEADDDEELITNGHSFKLKQAHFHAPAEHQIDGIIYPMEMHMVHTDENGKLAVVGVLIKEGRENNVLAALWGNLPEQKEKHIHPAQKCDVLHLLPEDHSFFHYSGSLTTPPCSEGVEWFVMKTPIEMSKIQILEFKKLYHGNNRSIQQLEERSIEISE